MGGEMLKRITEEENYLTNPHALLYSHEKVPEICPESLSCE